jgi:hypothetical protein
MARPHTLFVQAQSLPWQSGNEPDPRWDVRAKILSKDEETGAYTAIIKIPAGFELPGPVHFRCDFEFYVLDGAFEVNGVEYRKDCYGFFPAGYRRDSNTSAGGAVVLALFHGFHAPIMGEAPAGLYREDKLITCVDVYNLEWKTGDEGSVTGKPLSPTIFTKKLRFDPDTQEQTFLYAALPHHPPPAVMKGKFGHPMIEEIFVLSGEYVFGDAGRMGPGGYCWWAENEMHGPAGSETGYNLFIRIYGGPLVNKFSSDPAPFSFKPPHAPALPDRLKNYAAPFPWTDPW